MDDDRNLRRPLTMAVGVVSNIVPSEITNRFIALHGENYERKITPHRIGQVIRRKLGLKTEKRHGNYAIASTELLKLEQLFEKYGVASEALSL